MGFAFLMQILSVNTLLHIWFKFYRIKIVRVILSLIISTKYMPAIDAADYFKQFEMPST